MLKILSGPKVSSFIILPPTHHLTDMAFCSVAKLLSDVVYPTAHSQGRVPLWGRAHPLIGLCKCPYVFFFRCFVK